MPNISVFVMFLSNADNFYHLAKPLHVWSKFIGITSFSIQRKNGSFIARATLLNWLGMTLSTLWSLSLGITIYLHVNKPSGKHFHGILSSFEKSVYSVLAAIFVSSTLSNWWIFFARHSFCEILNSMTAVDEELKAMKIPINMKKQKKFVLVFLVILKITIVVGVCATYYIKARHEMIKSVLIGVISSAFFIQYEVFPNIQFVLLVWSVKLRYQKINFYLKRISLDLGINGSVGDGNQKLSDLASIHDKLVDVSESINRCYGFPVSFTFDSFLGVTKFFLFIQMMMVTANNFAFIIINAFGMTKLFLKLGSSTAKLCLNNITWMIIYTFLTFLIVHMGHFTRREVFS